MVFDPCPKDALVIIRSDFFLAVISNALAREGCDIVWFYSKNGGADDFIIKGLQVFRSFEHDVRGAFNLLYGSGVRLPEAVRNRAVTFGKGIQNFMEIFRIDPVR